ncbi:hypothetical protein FKX85_12385 [Echinicola soli]|uniref:Neuromedin U n=1 Tax=Echinicola soli TaxID=2591634 RepID=A0A514CJ32_9BACT|nr:hypothetical protein [Echinicola soli]QDH79786.1 hypothetical protein FKX85_12385 [Echinicola soli]
MKKYLFILSMATVMLSSRLFAQDGKEASSSTQANNPLANMTALNFHNYYIPRLTDAPKEAYLNNSWVRFAKPISEGKWLLRVSAPLNTTGIPNSADGTVNSINGLGDVNAFMSYNFISKSTATVGIGPNLTAPTATETALGTGKWQGGFAMVAFIAKSAIFQFGGLVTWQASFAGDSDRPGTNVAAIQPFYFWQLGKGTYLRGSPIWAFDFKNDAFSVPLGLGIGKVVKVENTMFNLFIEPQYSMLHAGTQPQFQLFTGINLQFMGK